MGQPPWITTGQPCGTPNGTCIDIDGIEVLVIIALIYAFYKLLKKNV